MRNTGKVTRLLLLQLVEAGEPTAPLNDLAGDHGHHEDDSGVNASTQRRPCRSARLSEAVSPAKSASVAIGLIVVKSVAKSLLILINRGDIRMELRGSAT